MVTQGRLDTPPSPIVRSAAWTATGHRGFVRVIPGYYIKPAGDLIRIPMDAYTLSQDTRKNVQPRFAPPSLNVLKPIAFILRRNRPWRRLVERPKDGVLTMLLLRRNLIRHFLQVGLVGGEDLEPLMWASEPAEKYLAAYLTDDQIKHPTAARARQPVPSMERPNGEGLSRLLLPPLAKRITTVRINAHPEIL